MYILLVRSTSESFYFAGCRGNDNAGALIYYFLFMFLDLLFIFTKSTHVSSSIQLVIVAGLFF